MRSSITGELLDPVQARELRKMRRQPFLKIGLRVLKLKQRGKKKARK